MPIITLTTDFGWRDGYVGAMKGVIARRAPDATVVDLAHEIPPGDIAHAAWVVTCACPEFPPGTIHVVVVDPGVGSARRAVVASDRSHYYVAPDNGVLGYVRVSGAWEIEQRPWLGARKSATFHGRDVFAPAAAALAGGMELSAFGSQVALAGTLPWGVRDTGEGRVVHVDTYGNLVTDLPASEAGGALAVGGVNVAMRRTYSDVAPGELVAYVGSMNTVEVAVRDGRADRALQAPRGTRVVPVVAGSEYR